MKLLCFLFATLLCGCSALPNPSAPKSTTTQNTPLPTPTEKSTPIGHFITDILDTDPDRIHNLQLCASVLTGVRVSPGETFSFNATLGERTKEKGYAEAAVLIDGKRGYATGGGICQVSSTLYNAADVSGMKILERHSHTKPVQYVEIDRDAAVVYGAQDFRFTNPLSSPVSIEIRIENTQVHAIIYKIVTEM